MHTSPRRSSSTQFAKKLHSTLLALCLPGMFSASFAAHAQTLSYLGSQSVVATGSANGLQGAEGVAVDATGDLFLTDTGNNRVLEIPFQNGSLNSAAQTVLVGGLNAPTGIVLDAQGNLYISDTGNSRVVKLPLQGGSYNAASLAAVGSGFSSPEGLAFDAAGDLYIADTGKNRIEVLSTSLTQTTVPISGQSLSGPTSVAVDALRDVFVGEYASNTVLELPHGGGAPITILSGALQPGGVALDTAANLFVADVAGNKVVRIAPQAGAYSSSNLATVDTLLSSPGGLAILSSSSGAASTLYIASVGANSVVRFALGPASLTAATGATSALSTALLQFNQPETLQTISALTSGAPHKNFSVAPGGSCATGTPFQTGDICSVNLTFSPSNPGTVLGALFLADSATPTPDVLTVGLKGIGTGAGVLLFPGQQTVLAPSATVPGNYNALGIAVDGVGNVFVAAPLNNPGNIVELPTSGAAPIILGTSLNRPFGVAIDPVGNLLIADTFNGRVVKLPFGGGVQTTVATGFSVPSSVAVNLAGDLYVADTGAGKVYLVPANGGARTTVGTGLSRPSGVAVDASGNVFIADAASTSILEVPANGGAQTTIGSGLAQPAGVAVDQVGNVYAANTFNNLVTVFPPAGASFNMGTGMSEPGAVAVDQTSNAYIADTNNGRVLEVSPSPNPTVVFPSTAVGSTASSQFVVQNSGTDPLNFSAMTFTTTAGGNFTLDPASTCATGTPLSTGQTCLLIIDFVPQGAGASTGTLVLSDNGTGTSGAQQTISLSGTSSETVASFTISGPASVVYGNTSVVYTATALDANGHVDTAFNGPYPITVSGSLNTTLNIDFVQGVAQAPLPVLSPGTYTFTITDGAVQGVFTLTLSRSPVTIASSLPSIQYGQAGPIPATLSGAFPSASAASPSGAVSYSIDGAAQPPVAASIGTVSTAALPVPTTLAVGPHTLSVSYPGDANFLAAAQTFTFTVAQTAQTITFAPPPSVVYGASPLTLTATSTSGLPVSFSLVSGPARLAGSTLTFLAAGPVVVEATQAGDANHLPAAPVQQTILVKQAPLTIAITGETIVFGTALPSSYPTQVTGLVNGDTIGGTLLLTFVYTPNVAPVPGGGVYNISATLSGTAAADYALTVVPGKLTVTPAAATISLATSQATANFGTPITFTAIVSTAGLGQAAGIVSFYDGASTLIGTAMLDAQNTATLTTSSLPAGTHAITASYGGSAEFLPVASASLTETIISPDYTISANPPSLSIPQGETGVVAYTMTPTGNYKGTVTFSCSGLPIWASCSFAPATLAADGSNTAMHTTMTIITLGPNHGTVSQNAAPANPASLRGGSAKSMAALAWLAPGMLLGVLAFNRRRKKFASLLSAMFLLCVGMGALTGCGFKQPTVPMGTYNVIVTATGATGSVTHNNTLSLTITQ